MEDETREHLLKLINCSLEFANIYSSHVRRRGVDGILQIAVYAEIGIQIAGDLNDYDSKINKELFMLIEEGMNGDYELSTAVATGLLEALYSRADNLGNWTHVKECLGAESRRFADLMSGTEANGDPAEHRE